MKTDLTFSSNRFREALSPFTLGPNQRRLRLFMDRKHLGDGKTTELLDEFASHDELTTVTTYRDGQDRIIFGDHRDDLDVLLAQVITDTGVINTGVRFVSQWEHFARQPVLREGLTLPPGPWTHEAYRREQYLLARIADSLGSDAFVTDDPFLLEFRRPDFIRLNFLSSVDAVALIGSYLRNRREFTIQKGRGVTTKLGRGLFYWVLARELLPSGWRWFSAIIASDAVSGGDLALLGQSLLTRVAQALKARDHAHWQLLQPQNYETADDALFYLDIILLSLSAAFDVVARIADAALTLGNQAHRISWNSESWRRQVRRAHAPLDAAMARSDRHGQTHRLLSLLRNSIHGEALTTLASQSGEKPLQHLLVLPKADRDELRYLITQLGGLGDWGYEDLASLFACVKPGLAIEQLLPRAVATLDELVALTPIERLPGLGPSSQLMAGPPTEDFWNEATRSRVRLLAGC